MSFEQFHFHNEEKMPLAESSQPYEILENLRKLQNNYLTSESLDDKATIEQKQRELISQLQVQAKNIIEQVENPDNSEEDKDQLMGEYGEIMDQLAVNLPWLELSKGEQQNIQNEVLPKLQAYLEIHPQAEKVARSIFMFFHHGAGVDKNLVGEAYQREINGQPLTNREFARQYLEAENKGKLFLEKYIALTFGKDQFSLDSDYEELIKIEPLTSKQFTCLLDVANWYKRVAYFQKIAGLNDEQELNAKKALELYKKLAEKNSDINQSLAELSREQGIDY